MHGTQKPRRGRGCWLAWLVALPAMAAGQAPPGGDATAERIQQQELLRQQERERALRQREESGTDLRLERPQADAAARLPAGESPCFVIERIELAGDQAGRFDWALAAADPADDPASGRCLGTAGVNLTLRRVQNAVIARGFVTTRVVAAPQDLKAGTLTLTLVPGRVRAVRFAEPGTRATAWNAVPVAAGGLLNLRDVEQALENFKRLPTVEADIRILPADAPDATPGDSDLLVSWRQSRPYRIGLSLDDSGSEDTGRYQAGLTVALDHLARANDLAYVHLGRDVAGSDGGGTDSWTAHYSLPFGYWQAGVTASAYEYRQVVPGHTVDYLYSGRSRNAEARLSRMLYRDGVRKLGAHARGWLRRSRNYIEDAEVEVQRRRMGGWELGLDYHQFLGAGSLQADLAYRRGTGAFDALHAPEEAYGEGTSRLRAFEADVRLSVPFALAGRRLRYSGAWRAQWNRTPLVPQDRFAIGGRYTVRGFDGETALTGDRGWLLRNELSLALGASQEGYVGLDYGRVGGPSSRLLTGDSLAGAVLGWRGGYRAWTWDVFVGTALHRPEGFDGGVVSGFQLGWSY